MLLQEELQEQLDAALRALHAGNISEAEVGANQVLVRIADASNDALAKDHQFRLRAQALRILAIVEVERQNYIAAQSLLGAALELCSLISDATLSTWVTGNIGFCYMRSGDRDTAFDWINKAYKLAENIADKRLMALNLTNIGLIYQQMSDFTHAIESHKQGLMYYEEMGDKANIASLLQCVASDYYYLGDYARSLEFATNSVAAFEAENDSVGASQSLYIIGSTYVQLAEYTLAFEYLRRALDLQEQMGRRAGTSAILGELGNAYLDVEDFEQALECYSRALAIDEEQGNKVDAAGWLGNIGNIHRSLSTYTKSLECYEQALSVFEENGYLRGAAVIYDSLGLLYSRTDFEGFDHAKAEEYFLRAIAINEKAGIKKSLSENLKGLSELYLLMGRKADAYDHFARFYQLTCEIQSDETKKQLKNLEYERQTAEREKQLAVERERARATTEVLHKVLPQSITSRMISGEKRIADFYPAISILFADIVGFTAIATEVPPDIVIDFLNYVFDTYDEIVKRHGCEKIKTIGDGYMAIAGAPDECTDHAERIARAAIEMQNDIHLPQEIRECLPKDAVFNIRIGIHTGAAVCGVIGKERFIWDVYSDAVNTAARMESNGVPGKIHVSKDFAWLLRSRQKMMKGVEGFVLEERGEMEIKGKGLMRTYFLERA